MNKLAAGMTDVGRCRASNQDELLVDPQRHLYAVADGMGGHASGEIASHLAIESLARVMEENRNGAEAEEIELMLKHAFAEGNRKICETVLSNNVSRGMGTTIVALVDLGDSAIIAHVGDSRAYLLRDGRLQRITRDHSYVAEQIKLGLLTEEDARAHPMRNIVTRALGNRQQLEVELNHQAVLPGDLFLLCSDGLNSMLRDNEIETTLRTHTGDPQGACEALIAAANSRGGEDNITVVILEAQPNGSG